MCEDSVARLFAGRFPLQKTLSGGCYLKGALNVIINSIQLTRKGTELVHEVRIYKLSRMTRVLSSRERLAFQHPSKLNHPHQKSSKIENLGWRCRALPPGPKCLL